MPQYSNEEMIPDAMAAILQWPKTLSNVYALSTAVAPPPSFRCPVAASAAALAALTLQPSLNSCPASVALPRPIYDERLYDVGPAGT